VLVQIGQGVDLEPTAKVDQRLRPRQRPERPVALGVPEQPPPQLLGHQRAQPPQVQPPVRRLGRGEGAPAAKRGPVVVADHHRSADRLTAPHPRGREPGTTGAIVALVGQFVPSAQPQRRGGQVRARHGLALPESGEGVLPGAPLLQPQRQVPRACALPAQPVAQAQPRVLAGRRPLRADPTDRLADGSASRQTPRRQQEPGIGRCPIGCGALGLRPQPGVRETQVRRVTVGTGPPTSRHQTPPPIGRVIRREDQHLATEQQVEPRPVDQGGERLQPIPAHPIPAHAIPG
jgi:hypothetical protein